jgi:T5SS/PEP-CTERM-associated repeat protein
MTRMWKRTSRRCFLNRTMHRPSLLPTKHARRIGSLALFLALAIVARLPGATVLTGDASPALPWSSSTSAQVGIIASGTLTVDGGSVLNALSATLGVDSGADGAATVTGAGSRWINSLLYVGNSGSGALRVEAGGLVGL